MRLKTQVLAFAAQQRAALAKFANVEKISYVCVCRICDVGSSLTCWPRLLHNAALCYVSARVRFCACVRLLNIVANCVTKAM